MNDMKSWAIALATLIAPVSPTSAAPMYHLTDLGGKIDAGGLLQYQPNGAIGGLNGYLIFYPQFIVIDNSYEGGLILRAGTALDHLDLPRGAIGDVFADMYGASIGEFRSGPNSGDALFLSHGMYQDLNDLVDSSADGWRLERADDMNRAGEIIGVGRDPLGELHAYMLTPIVSSRQLTTMVPEPSSVVLAGFGAVGLVAWGWRMRRA